MVHILMAVYNGGKYLKKQLDSIAEQTFKDWKLHIRDDGSTDNTLGIIREFSEKYPERTRLYPDKKGNLGAKGNFARLIELVREDGDYVFCDQDDIWDKDKLEVCLSELRKSEKREDGGIMPAMVCSDARLIDKSGNVTCTSFLEKSRLYVSGKHLFERLLLYNFAQGAAMMWNFRLHRLVRNIPEEAIMHDWWVALVAAGRGNIRFIPKQLLSYRQHDYNELGGFDRGSWEKGFVKIFNIANWREIIKNNNDLKEERLSQAKKYDSAYGEPKARRYIDIMKKGRLARAVLGIKEGYIFLSKAYSVKYYIL